MSLLAPWALWLSIVAAGVVALYILKIRRRRERAPSLEFWLALVEQTRTRSLFKRLRRLLSLLLWLAIVGALILAVGNPLIDAGRIKPRSIAVVIDNSASMQAVEDEDGRTRLDLAREALASLTAGRPVLDEWLVIDARREPSVVQPWTRDKRSVMEAAEGVRPFFGQGRPADAVELARQLLDGKPRPTVVVLSDGAGGVLDGVDDADASDAPGPAADGAAPLDEAPAEPADADNRFRIVHWPVGAATDNLGVTRASVRLHRQSSTHHALVRVESALDAPVDADLVLAVDGVTVAVAPMSIDPAGAWEDVIELEAPEGGLLEITIDRPDALAVDNTAYAVLEPVRPASVLLVSPRESVYFFEQALRAMAPLVSLEDSRVVTPTEYPALAEAGVTPDVTIFNTWVPESLPEKGAFICVGATPAEVEASPLGVLEAPRIELEPIDHPLTRYIVLRAASVAGAPRLALPSGPTVLASAAGGEPLIFLAEQPGRSILCIAFDVLQSDLPIRNAFPILLRNAVAHLSLEPTRWTAEQHTIGQPIRTLRPIPAAIETVAVARIDPERGPRAPAGVPAAGFVHVPAEEPHVLRLDIGDDVAFTAVNLASSAETRLAPPAGAAESEPEMLPMSASLFGAPPWMLLAVLATLLVGFEWLSFHMSWTE